MKTARYILQTLTLLLLLLAGQVAQATIKTVTYTIVDNSSYSGAYNKMKVTFTRSGDTPFGGGESTYTALYDKSALGNDGTSGYIGLDLADGFRLTVYWSAGSNVFVMNNSFYANASGKPVSYSVSGGEEYYVTHVTMKDAAGTHILYTSNNRPVDDAFNNVRGFYQSYSSKHEFGQLIVTYADAPTVLNLSLNEVDGRYWGSYFGAANYQLPEGAAAYTMNEKNNLYRVGTDGRIIPANTAVVILSDKKDITLEYTTEGASIHGNNILKGSVNPVTLNDGKVGDAVPFVLGMVNSTLGLYKYEGDKIPAGKAYYANGDEVYLNLLTENFTAKNGQTLIGKPPKKVIISIAAGATVTLQDVNINASLSAGLSCEGTATLILRGTNILQTSSSGCSGLQPGGEGTTLTIKGTGSLTAAGCDYGAGIGSSKDTQCGHIRIEDGTIIASGGLAAAGIGSGSMSSLNNSNQPQTKCGDILITGGTITAIGGVGSSTGNDPISGGAGLISYKYGGGAGIGSGAVGTCGNISISGGTVSAIGNGSAGIGSGGGGTYRRAHDTSIYKSTCGTVTITSGVSRVSAEKNGDAVDAIGRSTTDKSTCGKVTLGNTVYWTGSNYVNDDCKQYLQQNTLVYEP